VKRGRRKPIASILRIRLLLTYENGEGEGFWRREEEEGGQAQALYRTIHFTSFILQVPRLVYRRGGGKAIRREEKRTANVISTPIPFSISTREKGKKRGERANRTLSSVSLTLRLVKAKKGKEGGGEKKSNERYLISLSNPSPIHRRGESSSGRGGGGEKMIREFSIISLVARGKKRKEHGGTIPNQHLQTSLIRQ